MLHTISMIKKVFENLNLSYELDEDNTFFVSLDYGEKLIAVPLMILVRETEYLVYARFPNKIPKEALPRVAEFLHRANAFVPYCNFELDYDDGEVRVKSYVDFDHCQISYAVVSDSIFCPLNMLDTYFDALMRTIYSRENVQDLLAEVLNAVE